MLTARRAILPPMRGTVPLDHRLSVGSLDRLLGDKSGRRILRLLDLARERPWVVGFDPHSNFPYSTVQAGSTIIGSTATPRTILLAAGDGTSFPGGDGATQFNAVVWPAGSRPLAANAEIVRATRSGDILTTTARAQEGTTALATIAAGYQVMAAVTAKTLTDVEDISVAATSVAGLGTGFQGKRGFVRVGASPYSFAALTYSVALAKWVSDPHYWLAGQLGNAVGTDQEWVPFSAMPIHDYKALYDAGLRLQVICAGRGASAAVAWNYKLRLQEFNDGDTTRTTVATTAALVSGSAANEYKTSGWIDLGASPAEAHAILVPLFTYASNANSEEVMFGYRWASA